MNQKEIDQHLELLVSEFGAETLSRLAILTARTYMSFGYAVNPLRDQAFVLIEEHYGAVPSRKVRWLMLEARLGSDEDGSAGVPALLPRGPLPELFARASWPTD